MHSSRNSYQVLYHLDSPSMLQPVMKNNAKLADTNTEANV